MPARISAADFRDYIKKNFALEGGKQLKDYHLGSLSKAIGKHSTMSRGYHAPGVAALRYGKKAEAISEQRAFSLTKNLRDAVQKGEIELDGKKLEFAHSFKDVRGHGELRQSIRGIAEEAAKRAAPVEPSKEEIDAQKVQAANRRAIADKIIQRNIDATRPGSSAVTSVFDATSKGAPKKAAPDTSSLHSIPKVVSIGDFASRTQTGARDVDDQVLPVVGGARQAAVGEQGQPVHEPTSPATVSSDDAAAESSTVPPENADESDAISPPSPVEETPPPPAEDELPI